MSQGRKGKINYRCPECLLREIDYDLLYEEDKDQYYCRRCNWEGNETEILGFYGIYKMQYKDRLRRWTAEQIEAKDESE